MEEVNRPRAVETSKPKKNPLIEITEGNPFYAWSTDVGIYGCIAATTTSKPQKLNPIATNPEVAFTRKIHWFTSCQMLLVEQSLPAFLNQILLGEMDDLRVSRVRESWERFKVFLAKTGSFYKSWNIYRQQFISQKMLSVLSGLIIRFIGGKQPRERLTPQKRAYKIYHFYSGEADPLLEKPP
jgi:hypothetical protein